MNKQLTLVIKKRQQSQYSSSYHFYVEENGAEVADLFIIPARIHWNDQLKLDINMNIRDALKEVYDEEDIDNLQKQAWALMQNIHSYLET